jgi:hypothetical protein
MTKRTGGDHLAELVPKVGNHFASRAYWPGFFGDEAMAHADAGALRRERAPQSQPPAGATRELDGDSDVPTFSENDFDFPPTLYPGRELFTFSLFVLMIVTLVVWGGWKLISLI